MRTPCIMAALLVATLARAQDHDVVELFATDGASGDEFGAAVAMRGTTLAVGAPLADRAGFADSGAAYVFELDVREWTFASPLAASEAGGGLGRAVAFLDNDTVVVGAPPKGLGGFAYGFRRQTPTWLFLDQLDVADPEADQLLGSALAHFSGIWTFVGAPGDSDAAGGGCCSGAVYVYQKAGTTWTEVDELIGLDSNASDELGTSLDLEASAGVLVAGAPGAAGGGRVYVFMNDGAGFTERGFVSGSFGVPGDRFGRAVAISGDTLLVGAVEAVHVFSFDGDSWVEEGLLPSTMGALGTTGGTPDFGAALAFDGTRAIVGAPDADGTAADSGALVVYDRDEQDELALTAILRAPRESAEAHLGASVALAGIVVIGGAPGALDADAVATGAVYSFTPGPDDPDRPGGTRSSAEPDSGCDCAAGANTSIAAALALLARAKKRDGSSRHDRQTVGKTGAMP
jgi:hypothetical protein